MERARVDPGGGACHRRPRPRTARAARRPVPPRRDPHPRAVFAAVARAAAAGGVSSAAAGPAREHHGDAARRARRGTTSTRRCWRCPCSTPGLASEPLFDEPFFVLGAGARIRSPSRKHVREADLAGQRVLLLTEGHCLRDQALAMCGDGALDGRRRLPRHQPRDAPPRGRRRSRLHAAAGVGGARPHGGRGRGSASVPSSVTLAPHRPGVAAELPASGCGCACWRPWSASGSRAASVR